MLTKWLIFFIDQISSQSSTQRGNSVTEDKVEGREAFKQAATEDGCGEGLAKDLQGGNSDSGDVHGLQTSVTESRIFIQVLKKIILFTIISLKVKILCLEWLWFLNDKCNIFYETSQITAETLHFDHIFIVWVQIHRGGIWSPNHKKTFAVQNTSGSNCIYLNCLLSALFGQPHCISLGLDCWIISC